MSSSIKECMVLQPNYYGQFQCDPKKCLETCCGRWKIAVDKDTYRKYRETDNTIIKEIAETGLSLNKKAKGDEDFALIRLNKTLACPFLNEEGYCEVYINIGESSMSKTCKSYPRAATMINNVIERGLQMSCSIAAELALLNENGMAFEKISETVDFNELSVAMADIDEQARTESAEEIRNFIIEILQNRTVELSERISAVGRYLYQLISNQSLSNLIQEDIFGLMDEVRLSIDRKQDRQKRTCTTEQYKEQFDLLNAMLAMKFNEKDGMAFASKRYIECLWEVLDAFEDIEDEDMGEYYKENYEGYLKPYLDEKAYILENFLVNHVFIYGSELHQHERIWPFYMKLCAVYGLVKFNLIGLAIEHEGMNDTLALKLIQSLSRTILSDAGYLESVVEFLKEAEADGMSKMDTLIMD